MVHTSTGSHVIACSSSPSGLRRNPDNAVYLSKGENGQQVAYRVLQMTDLQHQQLNNNPAHQHTHHPHHHTDSATISGSNHQATLLGLSGTPAALLTAASPAHFHPHASGNGDGGGSGSGNVSPNATTGYYVMMGSSSGSSDQIPTHGAPAPRKKSNSINVADLSCASTSGRNSRDERRRATHNEVERRRRDKINNWITKLAKLVPDCNQDHTKQGQVSCRTFLLFRRI